MKAIHDALRVQSHGSSDPMARLGSSLLSQTELDAIRRERLRRISEEGHADRPHPFRLERPGNTGDLDKLLADRVMAEKRVEPEQLHDLQLWITSPSANALLQACVEEGLDVETANTVVHQTYHQANFRISGSHVFRVSPGLTQRLLHTSLTKLPQDYLQIPYTCIYLDVPRQADLYLYNDQTGWHPFEGCYVIDTIDEAGKRLLRVLAVGKPNEASIDFLDDALMYFKIELLDGLNLQQCIERHSQTLVIEGCRQEFQDTIPEVFRFVVNALLYTTSADAKLSSEYLDPNRRKLEERRRKAGNKSRKLAKIKEALKKTHPGKITVMGPHMRVLSPRSPSDSSGDGDSSWNPKDGFRVERSVMGHWKRVHTKQGPKVAWIKAYPRQQWVKYGATEGYEVR